MELLLPDSVKTALMGLIATAIVLGWLAPRFPQVAWLRVFRLPRRQLSPEEQERRRRAGNRHAAVEIMLGGLILPLLYIGSKVMLFDEPTAFGITLVALGSFACFSTGIWLLVRNW